MTIQDRLNEIEDCFTEFKDEGDLDIVYQDAMKLVKALRVALGGIDKWANYKSGAFAEGTLTEIERILNDGKETCPQHKWDDVGENCVKCGIKVWMT